MFITKSESPVVVVLRCGTRVRAATAPFVRVSPTARRSGSMEPAFRRGDILFLNNQDNPIRVGEVVVFKIKDRDIPIVHRVMKVHEKCGRASLRSGQAEADAANLARTRPQAKR